MSFFTIYTASKTKHAPRWRALRDNGIHVVSTWIDEASTDETKNFVDLWSRCVDEAADADFTLAYREDGEILKGSLIEIGAALAFDRPVMLIGDFSSFGTFMNHPRCTACRSVEDALDAMKVLFDLKRGW